MFTALITQGIPSIVTAVFPAVWKKFSPVMVIVVPPIVVPKSGVMDMIFAVLSLLYSTAFDKVISFESLYFITASH